MPGTKVTYRYAPFLHVPGTQIMYWWAPFLQVPEFRTLAFSLTVTSCIMRISFLCDTRTAAFESSEHGLEVTLNQANPNENNAEIVELNKEG